MIHNKTPSLGMKVDLHVHCKERSGCGKSWAEEQIVAARDAGLDTIAFTDHNRYMPEADFLEYNSKYAPFRILNGIEVDAEDEHILVIGVYDPILEKRILSYPELHQFVERRGGFTALAHPFRYRDTINVDLKHFPTNAIEVASVNTPKSEKHKILKVAEEFGIFPMCNSDSHIRTTIGQHYNITKHFPNDETELVHSLKSGEFKCGKEGE